MKKITKISLFLVSALMILGIVTINSCKKDDKLPQINGYDNSNQVASTYLKAHWTFDDTYNEAISATAPTNKYGTYGFEAGQIGKALKLTKGAIVFPGIANINTANALNNFSVSLWVKVSGNKKTADAGFTSFFSIIPTGVTDIWGDIMANAETSRHLPSSDTLELKNMLNTHPVGGGNSLQDNVAQLNDAGNGAWFLGAKVWSHYVMTWSASTHQFLLYGNAVSCGAWNDRGTTAEEIMAVPVQAVFGSIASSDIGFTGAPAQQTWAPWATASIDDVRVFNTTLSQAEVTALYNLGLAGR